MFSSGYLRKLTRTSVVLTTKDSRSFRGVLLATHKDCFVLSQSKLLGQGAGIEMSGELVVPRDNISFLQTVMPE